MAGDRAWARWALAVLASVVAAALLGQVFVAGLAVFAGPAWWPRHKAFVHTFEWLAPVIVVLVYVARAPRGAKWLAWIAIALLSLQYTTSEFRLQEGRQAWGALHPVGGVLLFWAATEIARRAIRAVRGRDASA